MPKIVDHDQYRKELLDKLLSECLDVIAEKGYAAITMREIAQGIGVSTGTLYHYFPSKENLFEQLVEYTSCQDTAAETLESFRSYPTIADRVKAAFKYLADNEEYFMRQMLVFVDFCRQFSREEINNNPVLQRAASRYEQAVIDVLDIQDPELAVLVANFIEGLQVRRLYLGDRISFSRQAELLAELIELYLKQKQHGA